MGNKNTDDKLRHLKSVTDETADTHIETLEMLRNELDRQIEKKKKHGVGRVWQGFQDTLFPYANTLIKEYETKGFTVKITKNLNMVTIELFDAPQESSGK
jgi:hypothetical protein